MRRLAFLAALVVAPGLIRAQTAPVTTAVRAARMLDLAPVRWYRTRSS